MSAAPRRQLRRALDALRQVEDTTSRFPDARQALEASLGPEGMVDLARATATIAHAVAVLDAQLAAGSEGQPAASPGGPQCPGLGTPPARPPDAPAVGGEGAATSRAKAPAEREEG